MKYLLETDWAVDYLRGKKEIVEKITGLIEEGIGISIITLAELYAGVYRATNPGQAENKLNLLLQLIPVIEIDNETCKLFGQENAKLSKIGQLIHSFDLLIAATALRHRLTLLTNNRQHFERIEELKLISV